VGGSSPSERAISGFDLAPPCRRSRWGGGRRALVRLTEGPVAAGWPLHHRIFIRWFPSPPPLAAGRSVVEQPLAHPYLPLMPSSQLNTDVVLGVAIPSRNARGRIARLGPVVDQVLANHGYPPAIEKLLAEALTLTALLGSLLKESEGQLTLQ